MLNSENLLKLADYLDSLPPDYKHFDMWHYVNHNGRCSFSPDLALFEEEPYLSNCGTVACAAGHGPAAGIPLISREFEIEDDGMVEVDWNSYIQRVFGLSNTYGSIFHFLFSSNWASVDNTPSGAAARIRYLLDDMERSVPNVSSASVQRYERYRRDR